MRAPRLLPLCLLPLLACGAAGGRNTGFLPPGVDGSVAANPDLANPNGPPRPPDGGSPPPPNGCGELSGCYSVYAHSDHILYQVDLKNKLLVEIGPFAAPMVSGREDAITDLAVAPDNTVYVISKTNLYTANSKTGHVTLIAPIGACGTTAVALTFTPDGALYAGDHKGAFCRIDLKPNPPQVISIGSVGGGYGLAGDLVAVGDGTMFGTVYTVASAASESDNTLVKIDPKTGRAVQVIGATGFPRLFGVAFEQGVVFGFTGDGSGQVITIDPKTGKGTRYNTFLDPTTNKGIAFAGAGVNSMVAPPPIM